MKRISVGLGSCVGLALYDSAARLACLVHIMLPRAPKPTQDFRYADQAVPAAIQAMCRRGACKSRLVAAIAGGAAMFNFGPESHIRIGQDNIDATVAALQAFNIPIIASHCGGSHSRTMLLYPATGEVFVQRPGQQPKLLANLATREVAR